MYTMDSYHSNTNCNFIHNFYCATNEHVKLTGIQQIVTLSKYGHDALDICHL